LWSAHSRDPAVFLPLATPCARQQPACFDVELIPRISRRASIREREFTVYAIVRCGGRQEKASVDDVLTVDKLAGEVGSSLTLPAVLVVDDDKVISDPAVLGRYQVTAEIIGPASGPKINMVHYKNKTGYRRRLGHRQKYTQVKITKISAGKAAASSGKKG
jgi:large subunit ribosomal protein L21